ncbi:MAG: vanadium-dependent haloperoxidase [Bacteroidota bacterium]
MLFSMVRTPLSARWLVLPLTGLLLLAACSSDSSSTSYSQEDLAYVTEWMETLNGLVRVERYSPPVAARVFSYTSVGLYESMVHDLDSLQTLQGQLAGLEGLPAPDPDHDALTVAITVQEQMARYFFEGTSPPAMVEIDQLAEQQRARRLEAGVSEARLTASQAFGETLAAALIEWARTDGFHERHKEAYDHQLAYTGPQCWIPTANPSQSTPLMTSPATDFVALETRPGQTNGLVPELASERMLLMNRPESWLNPRQALEPNWSTLRPLVIREASQCKPPPPPPYSEEPGSAFYEQVDAVYQASLTRTDEQVEIARYWADCPGTTGTPSGHWVMIMRQFVDQLHLSMTETIEMYATAGIGMQDAFISCWDEKYRSNLVRPITYIQKVIDPSFQTVVVTPPFPEYTSGHSVVSGTVGALLTNLLGDDVAFTDRTHAWLGFEERSYTSIDEAVQEAAKSRLYGGIHYPMAVELGVEQGACVAGQITAQVQTRR